MNRRRFLSLTGAGSVAAAAGAAGPVAGALAAGRQETLAFRAVTGLPSGRLPSYASYVLDGHVNLVTGTGMVSGAVFAGNPESMSAVALPGLTRTIRVTGVQERGKLLLLTGIIDDRSQLRAGESSTVRLQLDRSRRLVTAPFLGTPVRLRLQQ
jgi:hypothetical protein